VIHTIDRIGSDLTRGSGLADLISTPVSNPSVAPGLQPGSGLSPSGGEVSFRDALTAAADERSLHLSEHALKRVEQRQIPLAGEQLDRLSSALDQLSQRGSRQSLVMLDQYAYVVNAPSRTVVTAVDPAQSKDRVFTQIDSVVIA
jgi:flagellar operon protein